MNAIPDSVKTHSILKEITLKKENDSLSNKIKTLQKDKGDETTIKYINAIGAQWPFLLIIILTAVFLAYRKKIDKFFGKARSIKGGVAGASIEIVQEEIAKKSNEESEIVKVSSIVTNISTEEIDNDSVKLTEQYSISDVYYLIKEGKIADAERTLENIQSQSR